MASHPHYSNLEEDKPSSCAKYTISGLIVALLGCLVVIVYLVAFENQDKSTCNSGSHSHSSNSSNSSTNGYIIDGDHWHTIFYRFTNESGINNAKEWCFTLKNYSLNSHDSLNVITSVHCGIQNSIEQVSFGSHGVSQSSLNRSLEYGFAFTFANKSMQSLFTNNNNLYVSFRESMDLYRNYDSFNEQNYQGIWIFDWTHGNTKYSNIRKWVSLSYDRVAKNSTFHFVYFKFKYDDYTSKVVPTLIDNYRDLKNTIVSPDDWETLLVTEFSFGNQSSDENLSFNKHGNNSSSSNNDDDDDHSTEYGFVSTYNTYNEKEFMVGANHTARPVYDYHHDLFKNMIGSLHNGSNAFFAYDDSDAEGVFVFDFTDDIQL